MKWVWAMLLAAVTWAVLELLLRWTRSRLRKRILRDVLSGNSRPARPPSKLFLTVEPDGFTLRKHDEDDLLRVNWNEVLRIVAYKLDLLTTDCIAVAFDVGNDRAVEIHEEMDGFCDVMVAASQQFEGCRKVEEWLFQIAQPPFATNLKELYVRPVGTSVETSAGIRD